MHTDNLLEMRGNFTPADLGPGNKIEFSRMSFLDINIFYSSLCHKTTLIYSNPKQRFMNQKNIFKIILISFFIYSCSAKVTESEPQTGQAPLSILDGKHPLNEYFNLIRKNETAKAEKVLTAWVPSNQRESYYKDFFKAQLANNEEQYWNLYLSLKKSKTLQRLQLESLKNILDLSLKSNKFNLPLTQFKKESKVMIKRMRGLPEGLDFEMTYLRWVKNNNLVAELCKTERSRWLSQTSLKLSEVMDGLKECSMDFDDEIYRTRLLIFSGEEKKAQEELNEFIESKKMADWQKAYLQAVYYSNMGDPTQAFKNVAKYEKELLDSEDYRDNLFYIAQRAGELGKAEEIINKIIERVSSAKEKKEFTFQKALLFYQTKRYSEAITLFDGLIKNHPSLRKKRKSTEFDDLTWLRAWCYYLNRDYQQAKIALTKNREWAKDKTRNLYWLAMSEAGLGNNTKAYGYFKDLASPVLEAKFFNYYNYLAWLRFENSKNTVISDLLKTQISVIKSGRGQYLLPDGSSNPQQLVTDYQTLFEDINQTDEGDIQVVNQESRVADESDIAPIKLDSSSALKKEINWADQLLVWGYADFAKWHLYEVEKSFKTRASAEPLIQYYLEKKFYYRSLSLMQKVNSPQNKKLSLRDDELLWRALYPKAYQQVASTESTLRNIHPYLIWSIMKAETQFKYDAVSPVGAVGLMQFMPYTSLKVAQLLDEKKLTKELFQPHVAIQYGAMYLKKLSAEFDGQLPLIAAAYNGGPHRVKLWLRHLGDVDFDVFVEHIPFVETRTYVKRVLSYYNTYQKIYDDRFDFKKSVWMIEKNKFKLIEPISLKEEWDLQVKR